MMISGECRAFLFLLHKIVTLINTLSNRADFIVLIASRNAPIALRRMS